jgi:hypothetical protein
MWHVGLQRPVKAERSPSGAADVCFLTVAMFRARSPVQRMPISVSEPLPPGPVSRLEPIFPDLNGATLNALFEFSPPLMMRLTCASGPAPDCHLEGSYSRRDRVIATNSFIHRGHWVILGLLKVSALAAQARDALLVSTFAFSVSRRVFLGLKHQTGLFGGLLLRLGRLLYKFSGVVLGHSVSPRV